LLTALIMSKGSSPSVKPPPSIFRFMADCSCF
jgi:hypothetical protein